MNKLTPNLIVASVEPCLPFWIERLGFEKTVEVPHADGVGFVILKHGAVELMLQSRASLAEDVAELAGDAYRASLYLEVDDLEPLRRRLEGYPRVVPERTTFYGAREIIVRDPAGNVVCFACHERA
jgi:uncharacterized glyoxalase superfamily protein PhnB